MSDVLEKARRWLHGRKQSYQMTFRENDPDVDMCLADLAKFCRADKSTFHPDSRAHAVLEGRREVWLRIQQHLNLDVDKLWDLYKGGE